MGKEKNQGQKTSQVRHIAKDEGETPEVAEHAQIKALLIQAETSRQFSGPLPPPEILREFNDVLPGSAERILKMAEEQSAHRRDIENKVVTSDTYRANAGLWIGAAVAVLFAGAGTYLVATGHDVAGTTIATTVVVALVGVFVYGSISRRQERSNKTAAVDHAKGTNLSK